MRSEIRDRNNKRDTSFKLACLTAGCRDFRGKKERDWDCSLNWTQVLVIVWCRSQSVIVILRSEI